MSIIQRRCGMIAGASLMLAAGLASLHLTLWVVLLLIAAGGGIYYLCQPSPRMLPLRGREFWVYTAGCLLLIVPLLFIRGGHLAHSLHFPWLQTLLGWIVLIHLWRDCRRLSPPAVPNPALERTPTGVNAGPESNARPRQ